MILAVSGSLRQRSLNSAALRAAVRTAARSGIGVQFDESLRALPHFDPDLEADPPQSVQRFRATCARAEAVLFAVPEYAFGIPGTFKNALDWTVGTGALYRKPVAVLSVALPGRGANVRVALGSVLAALDCKVSWHHVPIDPSLLDDGEIRDAKVAGELASVFEALVARRHARSDGAQPALSG
jgi:chromate reductase, NAD(P)H dehydrogenase (quinone)